MGSFVGHFEVRVEGQGGQGEEGGWSWRVGVSSLL